MSVGAGMVAGAGGADASLDQAIRALASFGATALGDVGRAPPTGSSTDLAYYLTAPDVSSPESST
jgi:hypothetical protein